MLFCWAGKNVEPVCSAAENRTTRRFIGTREQNCPNNGTNNKLVVPRSNIFKKTCLPGMLVESPRHRFGGKLSSWDVTAVHTTRNNNFTYDINDWNTSNVQDMSHLFSSGSYFAQNRTQWDSSAVINASWMFVCHTDFQADLRGWNLWSVTSSLDDIFGIFDFQDNLTGRNIGITPSMTPFLGLVDSKAIWKTGMYPLSPPWLDWYVHEKNPGRSESMVYIPRSHSGTSLWRIHQFCVRLVAMRYKSRHQFQPNFFHYSMISRRISRYGILGRSQHSLENTFRMHGGLKTKISPIGILVM